MLLVKTIENALDELPTKVSWTDIAIAAEVDKSTLSHAKKGTEIKFQTQLKITKYIFKEQHARIFKDLCLEFNQPINLKYSLEFLSSNKHIKELRALLEKVRSKSGLEEWYEGYSLVLMYLEGGDLSVILERIRLFKRRSPEIIVLMRILEITCRNRNREYSSMANIFNGLESSLASLKADFIKDSYQVRIKELYSYIHLYNHNNNEEARNHAEQIISMDFCATSTTNSYYIVGMSYLFNNYDKCVSNIMKFREMLIRNNRNEEADIVDNHDIPFIKNFWCKHEQKPEIVDISEQAHYLALNGDKRVSISLLDKVVDERGVNGFNLYYKGLATGDKTLFMQSLIYFINKKGDRFYANLPYSQLKDDPMFKPMADLLFFE